jgi:hypothetical protein
LSCKFDTENNQFSAIISKKKQKENTNENPSTPLDVTANENKLFKTLHGTIFTERRPGGIQKRSGNKYSC